MEDLIDSSDISQYRISSLKDIPSNLKSKNHNLIVVEISDSDLNNINFINRIENSENDVKSIYLIDSENSASNKIPEKYHLKNYLFKPYTQKNLREIIARSISEFSRTEPSPAVKEKTSFDNTQRKTKSSKSNAGKDTTKSVIDFSELVENSPLIIFTLKNGRFTYINKAAIETLKYTKEEFLQLNPETLISSGDLDKIVHFTSENSKSGKNIKKINTRFKTKDGEPIEVIGEVKRNKNSDVIQFYFSRLTEPEERNDDEIVRLAAAVKSLNSAVTITDTEKKIIYVNPAHKEMFGYEPSELIGKSSAILYPSQDPSGISEKIYEAIFLVGWQGERIAVRKNGEVFQVFEKTTAIKDKNGKEIGIVSVHDDITKRKRLEQALKESEEKYRTLIETASTAVIAVNDEGIISIYNPAAENLFEYTKKEITDKNISTLISEEFRAIFESGFNKEKGRDILNFIENTTEIAGIKKSGDEFPIEVSVSKCKIEGRLVYTFIIFDITERKNLEQQLLQSAKLAAVGELVSGVTHEVNNPLAVVLGYSEMLLQEYDEDEELSKIIRIIYNESERARKVIHNLLSFARQHKPDKEPCYLNDIIENTLSLADYELRKHNVTVEKNYDEKLSMINADPNQLQQVFLNLIINAQHAISEFKDSGNIKISTSLTPDSRYNQICVEDDGPGIPDKVKEKIFDPFFTTKPVGKGTGLGLSVSFGIIDKHSGEMSVESVEGKGTKFYIKIPVQENGKSV